MRYDKQELAWKYKYITIVMYILEIEFIGKM